MKKPSYLKIYEALKEQIINGDIPDGSRLPTEPELSSQYGVSIGTLRHAVENLERENFIRREQGRGTFVHLPKSFNGLNGELKTANDFVFGCALDMSSQKELNELYFDKKSYKKISLPSPTIIRPEISKEWQSCSLVQLPMTMFRLPELNNYLAPLPEEFTVEAEKVVPENILNECRTINGQLRLIPVVVNTTVCYCWKPGFAKAGIPLPDRRENDWDSFIGMVRKLTEATGVPGFGLMPFPGLFYEILLWSLGGDFFDNYGMPWVPENAFEKMIELLRTLYSEHICYNPSGRSVTQQQFFNKPEFCMTFFVSMGMSVIARPEEWHICPVNAFTKSPTAATVVGLGIPNNAPDTKTSLELLRRIFISKRTELLSSFSGATPGASDVLELWAKKQKVGGAENFISLLAEAKPLTGRTGYNNWYIDVYSIIDETAKGMLDIKSAHKKIISILDQHKVRNTDITILA